MGGFDKIKFEKFAKDNSLEVKSYQLSEIKQNEIFNEAIIKRIFLTKDGSVDLITNSTLTKSFLVLVVNSKYKKLEKSSPAFERYEAKARLDLINKIYRTFDEQLNKKYKVELNQRTIDRVKNSF
jgi:peptidyl-prolyl cis-trans isomerase D